MIKNLISNLGRNLLMPIGAIILLVVASCGKTEQPTPDPPKPSDISNLAGVVFPKEGATSTIYALFDTKNYRIEYSPKNYVANRSNILTPGQKIYFKNLDSATPIMCITGGTITASVPDSDKTVTFPVLSPMLGNRDIEMPVEIKFNNTTNPTRWDIKGRYECENYSFNVFGDISSKLNQLSLYFHYGVKNTSPATPETTVTWYTVFGAEDSNSSASQSPFKFEGLEQLFPTITDYTSHDILQIILDAKAISPISLGFSKDNAENLSITQIYQMICYGTKNTNLNECGIYINPYYWYYSNDQLYGPLDAYFDLSMPFYSFERVTIADNLLKIYINLSSVLNMKLLNHTWRDNKGNVGTVYYPLNTNLYKTLQFNIAKAFGDKAVTGVELEATKEYVTKGQIRTLTLRDSEVSRSLLAALFSLYSADSDNLARLRSALAPTFKENTQEIINIVSNFDNEIGRCRNFKFGFRYNNYWIVKDDDLSLYRGVWGKTESISHWY